MSMLSRFSLLSLLASCLVAGKVNAAAQPDPLFASAELVNLELLAPFSRINRERDKDQAYEGTLVYTGSDGRQVTLDVELSVRGNFRLRRETCNYAPLWLNFRRGQVEGTLFDGQNRIKLVVQCRNPGSYRNFLVKEEQAYRLFNTLSEISFLTRMAEVSFTDSERNGDSRSSLAFFIEHHDRLAERVGLQDTDVYSIERSALDEQMATLAAMFMYMVSNVDYSLIVGDVGEEEDCCHNTKLLQQPGGSYFPVPYDFDVTGYVDASYGEPLRELRQSSLRTRVYRGFCTDPDNMTAVLDLFNRQRPQMNAVMAETDFLDERATSRSRNFIDGFFEIINDREELAREVLDECR